MFASKNQHTSLVEAFQQGTPLTYKKGEFIIRPGENPQGVFYIVEGLVKAYDITKYGEENLLIIRKANEIFPLIWSITGEGRHVIYEALSPVKVLRLDQKKYLNLLKQNQDLLPPLLDVVLEMYRIHSERIINLEYRSVRERLISFLLIMSQRFGETTKDGIFIEAPLKQQDIASSINATRETTGRELAQLIRKGFITNVQSHITIKNEAKLRSFL
jgi:CRP-like cAMP-binding protein